jgi:hypothetical protein
MLLNLAYNVSGKEMDSYAWLRMLYWRTQSVVVHFCDTVSIYLTSVIQCFHKTSLTNVSELLNTSDCMNHVSDTKYYVWELFIEVWIICDRSFVLFKSGWWQCLKFEQYVGCCGCFPGLTQHLFPICLSIMLAMLKCNEHCVFVSLQTNSKQWFHFSWWKARNCQQLKWFFLCL